MTGVSSVASPSSASAIIALLDNLAFDFLSRFSCKRTATQKQAHEQHTSNTSSENKLVEASTWRPRPSMYRACATGIEKSQGRALPSFSFVLVHPPHHRNYVS